MPASFNATDPPNVAWMKANNRQEVVWDPNSDRPYHPSMAFSAAVISDRKSWPRERVRKTVRWTGRLPMPRPTAEGSKLEKYIAWRYYNDHPEADPGAKEISRPVKRGGGRGKRDQPLTYEKRAQTALNRELGACLPCYKSRMACCHFDLQDYERGYIDSIAKGTVLDIVKKWERNFMTVSDNNTRAASNNAAKAQAAEPVPDQLLTNAVPIPVPATSVSPSDTAFDFNTPPQVSSPASLPREFVAPADTVSSGAFPTSTNAIFAPVSHPASASMLSPVSYPGFAAAFNNPASTQFPDFEMAPYASSSVSARSSAGNPTMFSSAAVAASYAPPYTMATTASAPVAWSFNPAPAQLSAPVHNHVSASAFGHDATSFNGLVQSQVPASINARASASILMPGLVPFQPMLDPGTDPMPAHTNNGLGPGVNQHRQSGIDTAYSANSSAAAPVEPRPDQQLEQQTCLGFFCPNPIKQPGFLCQECIAKADQMVTQEGLWVA